MAERTYRGDHWRWLGMDLQHQIFEDRDEFNLSKKKSGGGAKKKQVLKRKIKAMQAELAEAATRLGDHNSDDSDNDSDSSDPSGKCCGRLSFSIHNSLVFSLTISNN